MNDVQSYDRTSQVFHWVMAVLIFFLIAYHPSTEEGHAAPDALVIGIHVTLGFLLLFLVIARLVWRFRFASLPPEPAGSGWQRLLRQYVYIIFYVLMLLAPLAGIVVALAIEERVQVAWLLSMPQLISNDSVHALLRSTHGMMADLLLYLGLLHFAAALYHQFYLKDKLLKRMIN
jgi:cytochrome b561